MYKNFSQDNFNQDNFIIENKNEINNWFKILHSLFAIIINRLVLFLLDY